MTSPQYFPEPTEDAPIGSIKYLESSCFPWPHENNATDETYEGKPMARIGPRLVFYFRDADLAEVRNVTTIVEQYVPAADGRIPRHSFAGDKRERFAPEGKLPDLAPLRKRAGELNRGWSVNLSAEIEDQCASPWSLAALADGTGYLVVHFPLTYFVGGQRGSLRTLFQRWCTALKVEPRVRGLRFHPADRVRQPGRRPAPHRP